MGATFAGGALVVAATGAQAVPYRLDYTGTFNTTESLNLASASGRTFFSGTTPFTITGLLTTTACPERPAAGIPVPRLPRLRADAGDDPDRRHHVHHRNGRNQCDRRRHGVDLRPQPDLSTWAATGIGLIANVLSDRRRASSA